MLADNNKATKMEVNLGSISETSLFHGTVWGTRYKDAELKAKVVKNMQVSASNHLIRKYTCG